MQLSNTGNIQNQVASPIQKKQIEQNQKPVPVPSSARSKKGDAATLPEDIVTLSSDSIAQSANSKSPSIPVSIEEKDALLKPSSDESSISIYA